MSRGAFVEKLDHWKKYYRGAAWEKAFAALEQVTPETPDGVIQVQGNDIRVIVMSYQTKSVGDAVVESHEDFIDIQMMISGHEIFRWWPAAGLQVSQPYDAAKDITFYQHGMEPLAEFAVRPGDFAVFMPGDAHSTQIHPAGAASPQLCRKAVVKLRASLLEQSGAHR
jgi:biofilm protein TabA